MKKLIVFVAIATVIFTSCESKSGKRVKTKSSCEAFKEMIEKSRLDSSLVNKKENVSYYVFYLPEYKIDIQTTDLIPFESAGKIEIFTRDISGKFVNDFCSSKWKWDYKEQNEILQLLLSKKEKTASKPIKDEPKFVLFNN